MRGFITLFNSEEHMVLFWNNSNGIHFCQEIGVPQARNKHNCDYRRVGRVTPDILESCITLLYRLPLDNVDVPLDDMFQLSTASSQRCLDIFQNLFRLCLEVAFTNNIPRRIDGILPTYIYCLRASTYDHDICEGRVLMKSVRV